MGIVFNRGCNVTTWSSRTCEGLNYDVEDSACHIVVRGWGLAGLGIYSCFHTLRNIVLGGILIWLRNCMIYNNRLDLSISNMNIVMVYCYFELST